MFNFLTKTRSASARVRVNLVKSTLPRTMATSAASNDDLKVNKLFDVSNYSAIVTGGGTGIGLMITQTLVANGAKVYITGRRKKALDTVVEKYSKGPGNIIAYVQPLVCFEISDMLRGCPVISPRKRRSPGLLRK
jgi:hypothetical protein